MEGAKKKKIIWCGVSDIGKIVTDPVWLCRFGTVTLTDGYKCCRKLVDEDKQFDVTCSIFGSRKDNIPLFRCIVSNENGDVMADHIAKNPTTAVKKVLKSSCLDHFIPLVNTGNIFFGLNLAEVKSLQENLAAKPNDDEISESENSNEDPIHDDVTVSSTSSSRNASWLGIVTYGMPFLDDKFSINVGQKKLRLQPGFESMRHMKLPNDDGSITIHNKIEKKR